MSNLPHETNGQGSSGIGVSRAPESRSGLWRHAGSPYLTLSVLALVCHGVLLLCDYKIWDGG